MEWEAKTEMIRFFNQEQDEQALNIVLENIDNMDGQAWDMFLTALTLTQENINLHRDKHKIISDKMNEFQLKSDSFRTAIRMALYAELTKELTFK